MYAQILVRLVYLRETHPLYMLTQKLNEKGKGYVSIHVVLQIWGSLFLVSFIK